MAASVLLSGSSLKSVPTPKNQTPKNLFKRRKLVTSASNLASNTHVRGLLPVSSLPFLLLRGRSAPLALALVHSSHFGALPGGNLGREKGFPSQGSMRTSGKDMRRLPFCRGLSVLHCTHAGRTGTYQLGASSAWFGSGNPYCACF